MMAAKDRTDLWWGMYQEHTVQGRHHETLRNSASALVLTLTGAAISLVSLDKGLGHGDWPWGLFLCALGLFGGVFNLKQYERFKFHTSKAQAFRHALDLQVAGGTLRALNDEGGQKHKASRLYRSIGRVRLYGMWLILNGLVVLVGCLIVIFALQSSA